MLSFASLCAMTVAASLCAMTVTVSAVSASRFNCTVTKNHSAVPADVSDLVRATAADNLFGEQMSARARACVCACVRARARACACVCVRVRARVRVRVHARRVLLVGLARLHFVVRSVGSEIAPILEASPTCFAASR